ncbi:uncharacterized protein LOC144448085 [Glandiceps talaboti]
MDRRQGAFYPVFASNQPTSAVKVTYPSYTLLNTWPVFDVNSSNAAMLTYRPPLAAPCYCEKQKMGYRIDDLLMKPNSQCVRCHGEILTIRRQFPVVTPTPGYTQPMFTVSTAPRVVANKILIPDTTRDVQKFPVPSESSVQDVSTVHTYYNVVSAKPLPTNTTTTLPLPSKASTTSSASDRRALSTCCMVQTDLQQPVRVRRERVKFSPEQLHILKQKFKEKQYLLKDERRKISVQLDLTDTQVKNYFQNQRMKLRHKEKQQHQQNQVDKTTKQDKQVVMKPEVKVERK